jgi:PIN domain nuclease of toxin-antitoxin system
VGRPEVIVLDTHVLIWFLIADSRLDVGLRVQMESQPEAVLVPSVCIWEATLLVEKGRLGSKRANTGKQLRQDIQSCRFSEVPLTGEIAVLSRTLQFDHEDPADRFIAATAYALDARLATSDFQLRRLKWVNLAY